MKIVHASISENGTITGKAGDSTGKEVCVREWYNKPWDVVLRYKDTAIANKALAIAKRLAESNLVGYNQTERNTLYKALKKYDFNVEKYISSGEKTNTDCSAFVFACYASVIASMRYDGNAPVTSTMLDFYEEYGFYVLTDSKYLLSGDNLKTGDILLSNGHHTALAYNENVSTYSNTLDNALTTIAKSAISGTFGNAPERKDNIYKAVQAKVNSLLSG